MRFHQFLLTALAPLVLLPLPARPQGALPMPLEQWTLVDLNAALNDAFNDDLEDICRCRNVSGATRFEELVEELEALEEAIAPERLREGLLEEGIDIPVEPGDTPRRYLERVQNTWSWTASYRPLRDRLHDLQSDAQDLERLRENRGNPYDRIQPPPDVDREVEILRTLREALADCRGEEEVPPPPEDRSDFREGLLIDLPREGPAPEPVTEARLREALLNEIRNLCCKIYDGVFGAWMGNATLGLDDAPADVQATARAYRDLLWDLATTMDTRGFHEWVEVEPGLVRKRCDDEVVESVGIGLVMDLEDEADDPDEVGTPRDPRDPSVADPTPVPSDEAAVEADEEPAPRDPPDGFRHVTRGSNPSRYTPESNHVTEGPDASVRARDFFDEGREVPHVEDGVFTDRHLTAGEHASQYVDPELHVAEGPGASALKGDPLPPPEGQRHLDRGPGATSYVPEERHVAEGPQASGLRRGGGGAGVTDEEDEEADEDEQDEEDGQNEEEDEEEEDTGGELARNPDDHNPGEVADAPPARDVQRMIVEIGELRTTDGQEGPGGSIAFHGADGTAPDVYLISLGTSTGRTFRVHAVGESADLSGVVVVEPVAVPARERRRIDERLRAAGSGGAPADGYCLEFERLVPPPGTLYRLSSREVQGEHAPVRRILSAGRRLREAGAFHPDTDPEQYFHAVRQWAIWTREQGFDEPDFVEGFLERTRKNFRAAGQEWNDDVEAAVRALLPNRWRDVQAVLSEAGR